MLRNNLLSNNSSSPSQPLNAEQLKKFSEELGAIHDRIREEIGKEDVSYIQSVRRVSRLMEVVGRSAIHFSFDPITFSGGVVALWLHKQLETTEIGHTVLHGAFDNITDLKSFHSKTFRWDMPIDEQSWRYGHNRRHHAFTNINGKDPDTHFGIIRLNPKIPHHWIHYTQLPVGLFLIVPNFAFSMNAHFTGLLDVYDIFSKKSRRKYDFLQSLNFEEITKAHYRAFRKYIPYYTKNYVFYPALAGPFFGKVLLGNWLAELFRDIYSAATIFCGHVGPDTKSYSENVTPKSHGDWYVMQIEASNNFEVSLPFSILCGALDCQIEHHLFPKLPPNRLRQIAPKVRAVCKRFGVNYKSESWPKTLTKVLKQVAKLSLKGQ